MLKGLSLILLGAGLTLSTLTLMNKQEEGEPKKKVTNKEIKEAIEKAKIRRDNGEISEEGYQELAKALEGLLSEVQKESL